MFAGLQAILWGLWEGFFVWPVTSWREAGWGRAVVEGCARFALVLNPVPRHIKAWLMMGGEPCLAG